MSFIRNVASIALLFLSGAGVHAGERPPPSDIAQAIKELGDDKFAVRERAAQFLWKAGAAAEPALLEAAKSADLEVKRRARDILERVEYGIYPDTPKNIVDLVNQFRAGDRDVRHAVVKKLLALEGPGYAVVVRIAAAEKELTYLRNYNDMLWEATPRLVTALLCQGNWNAVEELLEQAMRRRDAETNTRAADNSTSIRHYAAFLLLRGDLDKKIAQLSAPRAKPSEPQNAEVLAYLLRANGDLPSAFRSAEQSGNRVLQRWLLCEEGRWGELLERHSPRTDMKGKDEIQILGYTAAFQRLAGRSKDVENTIAEICRLSEAKKSPNPRDIAVALLLNDRPHDGMEVLIQAKRYGTAFDFLKHQLRYREAFALIDKAKEEMHKEAFRLEIWRACLLYELGEKEKALPLWTRFVEAVPEKSEYDWDIAHLVGCEYKLGDKDSALEHAALVLTWPKFSRRTSLFTQLFGDTSNGTEMWWSFLRDRFPRDDHLGTLKRMRSILERTIDRNELRTLGEAAAEWIPGLPKSDKAQRENYFSILGEACLAAGLDKEAQRYFEAAIEVAGGQAPLLRLADFLAEKKDWGRAAERYGQAWEKDKRSPLPLFLQGRTFIQAGQQGQGEKLMKLAHLLPLAHEDARYILAEALTKRGLNELALREWELLTRIGALHDVYFSNAQSRLGAAAADNDRFLEAAARTEASNTLLFGGAFFFDSASYLRAPQMVHRLRARGLLEAGKIDEALHEIRACLALLPAAVDLPIELTPLLEKVGRRQDGDDLFTKVSAHYEQLCADYPRCASMHNDLAWLSARCRRQLDKALTHAQKAVALAPQSASYLDTLAEVYFQRGDQAKAIELMNRCLEAEPQRDFYRRQLKRFETGDRFANVPSTPAN